MTEPSALLLLPRIRIQNANAISGPLSWGFPSPTAFTGFVHALERKFASDLENGFGGVGIICHEFKPQVFRPSNGNPYTFRQTRNPWSHMGKNVPFVENGVTYTKFIGKPASFVEEGRAHMVISLVIIVHDYLTQRNGEYFAEDVMHVVHGMRLAGGSILPLRHGKRFQAQWLPWAEDMEGQVEQFRRFRRQLLPGFALVQREDYLADHLEEIRRTYPDATALDALMDLSRLNYEPDLPDPEKPGETMWGIRRKRGWMVPIPIGYAGLSPLYEPGVVENSRDAVTPFRFVECLYSLGEWVSPHRIEQPQQLFWHYHTDEESGVYKCVNDYSRYIRRLDS